jgi:hypothetical protein
MEEAAVGALVCEGWSKHSIHSTRNIAMFMRS